MRRRSRIGVMLTLVGNINWKRFLNGVSTVFDFRRLWIGSEVEKEMNQASSTTSSVVPTTATTATQCSALSITLASSATTATKRRSSYKAIEDSPDFVPLVIVQKKLSFSPVNEGRHHSLANCQLLFTQREEDEEGPTSGRRSSKNVDEKLNRVGRSSVLQRGLSMDKIQTRRQSVTCDLLASVGLHDKSVDYLHYTGKYRDPTPTFTRRFSVDDFGSAVANGKADNDNMQIFDRYCLTTRKLETIKHFSLYNFSMKVLSGVC